MRVRDGILEHQVADRGSPEVWTRVGYDDLGNPRVIYQAATLAVAESDDGHVVFSFGGHLVSAPPDVAAAVNDDLVKHTLAGKGVQVAAQVERIQEQIDAKKAEHAEAVAAFDVEIEAKQTALRAATDELTAVTTALGQKQAALESAPGVP